MDERVRAVFDAYDPDTCARLPRLREAIRDVPDTTEGDGTRAIILPEGDVPDGAVRDCIRGTLTYRLRR